MPRHEEPLQILFLGSALNRMVLHAVHPCQNYPVQHLRFGRLRAVDSGHSAQTTSENGPVQ